MLFYLTIQHRRKADDKKEIKPSDSACHNELIEHQSYILKNSLLKKAKQMKKELKREKLIMKLISEYNGNENIQRNELKNNLNNIKVIKKENDGVGVVNNLSEYDKFKKYQKNQHRRCKSISFKILGEKTKKNENFKNENKCPICLDDYQNGSKIAYLPCFHSYHSKCIKKWLKYSKKCPICKNEL